MSPPTDRAKSGRDILFSEMKPYRSFRRRNRLRGIATARLRRGIGAPPGKGCTMYDYLAVTVVYRRLDHLGITVHH